MPRSSRLLNAAFLAILSSLLATAAPAVNETPKKRNAIIYGPHPSAQDVDKSIERWLCAENYSVTKHVWGRAGGVATIAELKSIAAAGFAVLVIVSHGSSTGITLEDFADEASAIARYNQYRNDPAYQDLKNDFEHGAVPEIDPSGGGTGVRYCVDLTAAGLQKLFGGVDGNRSIVCVITCKSWDLQTKNTPKPFGATEFLGYEGELDNKSRRRAARGFYVMGGPEGIPSRPVAPAFAGKMKHQGPGNTTLAPACTDHAPLSDTVLPLNVKTDGSTTYETKMKTSSAAIMEASGCEAGISDEAWTNETAHRFKVEPKQKGRLVLKVKPTSAVSQNNDNWLIGNLYRLDADASYEDPRPEVNECQFGQSGLDGVRPCVPPENPYRWCVWCGEKPADPPGRPKTPKAMGSSSAVPRRVAAGEQDAFVLYQDAPGAATVFTHSSLPPNMLFAQAGDWYGHVMFFPDASQIGQQFTVDFQTTDENGPRAEESITWEVVARSNGLALAAEGDTLPAGDLGLAIVRPGDPLDFAVSVSNTGSTGIEDISFSALGLPAPVTFVPDHFSHLEPGETARVVLRMDGVPVPPSGLYAANLLATGSNADGAIQAEASLAVRVNQPPTIDGPADLLLADVGVPLAVPVSFFDGEGDAITTYLERAVYGATLETNSEAGARATSAGTFHWTPPPDAAGRTIAFPVVADDGAEPSVHEILVQVAGTTSVGSAPPAFTFDAGPSPARGALRLTVEAATTAPVTIEVFDAAGRLVARPVDRQSAGSPARTWTWSPQGLDRGVYFVYARIGGKQMVRRIVWLGGDER